MLFCDYKLLFWIIILIFDNKNMIFLLNVFMFFFIIELFRIMDDKVIFLVVMSVLVKVLDCYFMYMYYIYIFI